MERLQDLFIKGGRPERLRLAVAIGRHEQTLDRWLRNGAIPSTPDAYKLAVAAGFTEGEALEIAKEGSPERETA